MLVEHSATRNYLLNALETAPELFEFLLRDLSDNEADFRVDAARFTLREIVAHLADWDAIFLTRMQRTRDESEPNLSDFDQSQLAIDNEYSKSDVGVQMRLFSERRAQIVAFARELSPDDWQRTCIHPRLGVLTMEALATLIPLHDAYHVRQILQWREIYAQNRS